MEKSIHAAPIALSLAAGVDTGVTDGGKFARRPGRGAAGTDRHAAGVVHHPLPRRNSERSRLAAGRAQLYVSTDRGTHWRLYIRVPTAQKRFTFRAGGDGEYWFAICTANRSGQVRPETIESPGLRVLVDTKPPVLRIAARPAQAGQVAVHWEIDEPNLKPNSLTIVYRPSPAEPWQAVAIDPRSQESPETLARGDVTFWPKPGSSEIPIHAEVSDLAGNTGVANAQVKLSELPAPRPSEPSAMRRHSVSRPGAYSRSK